MSHSPANRYAEWRERLLAPAPDLREDADHPPESLLQAVWLHQRLRRERLRTLDGQPLRVLHPGFPNAEAGPDFHGAILQFGHDAPQTGDVEVDLHSSGWHAHGHDRNPAFQNVLLHVVWDADPSRRQPGAVKAAAASPPERLPTLPLREALDAPLAELNRWLERQPARTWPPALQGRCAAPLSALSEGARAELLRQAAQLRFHARAAHLQARARHAGWEQALWEGVFRALGYKHNVWPMQCLAESRPRWWQPGDSVFALQARLLGLSGLLPEELPRGAARTAAARFLRQLWDHWWRERDALRDCALPRALWQLGGLRPANQPPRRLALAAHWLARNDLPDRLQRWAATPVASPALLDSLLGALEVPRDEFWSWHWTWNGGRLSQPQPLLGRARLTDLAINVFLPWLWARAGDQGRDELQAELLRRFLDWPSAQENALLRLARARLLGDAPLRPAGAALQQGLIQIVRDFCEHSNALCERCRFPELVRAWSTDDPGVEAGIAPARRSAKLDAGCTMRRQHDSRSSDRLRRGGRPVP